MSTLQIAPGLYAWHLQLADGSTREVLASSLAACLGGGLPVVAAQRGLAIIGDGSQDVPPTLASLNPATAVIGAASFTLHVLGSGFKASDTILWNGGAESTTFVSATELTTGVNMATATTPGAYPVAVRTVLGKESAALTFTLTPVE